MKFSALNTADAMGRELGERLKQARLNLNLTQQELGLAAGVSRYTVKNLEQGRGNVQDLIALLIALDHTSQLDNLMPPQQISPLELFKLRGRTRQRASGTSQEANTADSTAYRADTEDDIGW